ncbi:MAG: hypothetical protein AB7K41_11155 [Bdellovibrionales bacterium]
MRNIIILSMVLLSGGDVYSNSFFTPNHYRGRREANSFTAIAWSKRREVSFQYARSMTDTDTNGVRTEEDTTSTSTTRGYYRLDNGLNFEGFLRAARSNRDSQLLAQTDKVDVGSFELGLGYESPNQPFALAVKYNNRRSNRQDGATDVISTTRFETYQLAVGTLLADQIYMGLGYQHTMANYPTSSTVDDLDQSYYIGGGKVFGRDKEPLAVVDGYLNYENENGYQTYVAVAQALYNQGPTQYYGALNVVKIQGRTAGLGGALILGLDYQFGAFFIAPHLALTRTKYTDSTEQNYESWMASLEAGYRQQLLEFFAWLSPATDDSTIGNSKYKSATNRLTVGGSYQF